MKVVVVGAGASGLIAAWRAAHLGASVTLLEKTPRIGTKILISGGGKCNIAHDGTVEQVLKAFRRNEALFLRPSFHRFFNKEILAILSAGGLTTYTRPNGRIFPVDKTAKDVVAILEHTVREAGVEIRLNCPVLGLVLKDAAITGVRLASGKLAADRVIVTVGGSSYPGSGTTGDGYPWMKEAGHTIEKIRGALAPIHLVKDDLRPDLSGVALRDVIFKAKQGGKEIARWREDLLFTHHGVSGPCALGISREIAENAGKGEVRLEVDCFPTIPNDTLNQQMQAFATKEPKSIWRAFIGDRVPARILEIILAECEIPYEAMAGATPKKNRNRLVETLKAWNVGTVRDIPIEKGEVVAGGVSLDEVDPQTMASKLVRNLYLAGEILDIAGPVGGYNLQAAYSTGYVAGESAARG
ncbi:MAG: NAD(P)/FAD-dependent oxidoreductase [Armatimonadetes bacterium]|nr:NAD(P)/FAD-dependent oxidoreductase [Armatimonadota bacterium]